MARGGPARGSEGRRCAHWMSIALVFTGGCRRTGWVHGLCGSDPRSGAKESLSDGRLVRRTVCPDRTRGSECPFRHGEHGAATNAKSPGHCASGRKEGASILDARRRWNAEGARNSDEKVIQGQRGSAVEIHPLPARRPGLGRRFARCHNILNENDFSRPVRVCRES